MNTTKYIKKELFKILIFSVFIIAVSCQKVIELDLNSDNPQLVVEAAISNKPEPYTVKLSQTVNFTDITAIPPITGAKVVISDSIGNSETLFEEKPGTYKTKNITGIPGQTYTLSITTEGKTYKSVSHMPYPVEIQNLVLTQEKENRPSFGKKDSTEQRVRYQVNFEIADPGQFKNYYRFVTYYKSRELNSSRVFDDQFHNGKIIVDEFGIRDTVKFAPGDTILVELLSIDKGTYNFYRTLREGSRGLDFLSASPSNPITNLSDNALGYFSAFSKTSKLLIVPK